MSIFANLFKKQADADAKVVGNVEDFVSLTRVYFQSVIAVNLGITNIRFLPDVANFTFIQSSHTRWQIRTCREIGFPQDVDAGLRHQ